MLLLVSLVVMSYKFPEGWIKAGSKPGYYDMGIDPGAGMDGRNAATIVSNSKRVSGFGTMMQNVEPDKYKGKRIRLTGYIKAQDVDNWAGLWLRVDGEAISKSVTTTIKRSHSNRKVTSNITNKESRKSIAFDNMSNRPIRGTVGWTKCEIVLDVADSATNIAFGALLQGTGHIWFDKLQFDTVSKNIPTTSRKNKEPTNLDFEK